MDRSSEPFDCALEMCRAVTASERSNVSPPRRPPNFGAIGSAWQLAHGAADAKAAELTRLGVDPTFGLTLSLIYSAIAFSLFLWAWRQTSR